MPHQPIKETTFRAKVFDPAPPPNPLVWLAIVLPITALTGALFSSIVAGVFYTGFATLVAFGMRPRRRPREVSVVCKPGVVRLGSKGTLRARDLLGATTARFKDRVSLLLGHARRKHSPMAIDLPDEAALHAICESLGIGHHGFGVVDAVSATPDSVRLRYWASACTFALLLLALLDEPVGPIAAGLAAMVSMVTGIAAITAVGASRRILRLTSQGLYAPIPYSLPVFVPFATVEDVEVVSGGLILTTLKDGAPTLMFVPIRAARWMREGIDRAQLEHLAAQIKAASERAHGRFVLKDEPSGSIEILRRVEGESLRAWYARLDSLMAGSSGYRGAAIDSSDLWKLLEDPEADADLRSAAARVLSLRAPDVARVRVAELLAAVRDDRIRTRIAASFDEEALAREEQADAVAKKQPRRA